MAAGSWRGLSPFECLVHVAGEIQAQGEVVPSDGSSPRWPVSPQDRVGGGGPQSIQGLSGQQALWGLLGGTLEPNPATAPLSFQPSHGVWPGPSRKAESSLRQTRLLSNCDAGALGCSSCHQTGPQATTLCLWSHSPDPSPLFSDPQNGDMVFPGSTCESEQH